MPRPLGPAGDGSTGAPGFEEDFGLAAELPFAPGFEDACVSGFDDAFDLAFEAGRTSAFGMAADSS